MLLFQVTREKTQSTSAEQPVQPRKNGFMAERHGWVCGEMIEIEGKARGLSQAKIKDIKQNYQDFANTCYLVLINDDNSVRIREDMRQLGQSQPIYSYIDLVNIWKNISSCFWSNCTYSPTRFLSEAFDRNQKVEFTYNIPSSSGPYWREETKLFELSSTDIAAIRANGHLKKKGAGVTYDLSIKDGEMKVIGTGRFIDCDTSAYVIADILAKLGIETNIVFLPGHAILNIGTQSLYIETTGDIRTMEISTTLLYGSFAVEQKYKTAGVLLPFSSKIAYLFSGKAYSGLGKYDLAAEEFSKFIEAYPNLWDAYNKRGDAYSRLGKYDLALDDYNKADKLSPNNIGVKASFAYSYSKQNKHSIAIEYFTAAIKLADADKSISAGFISALFEGRGKSYSKIGKYQEAIADFTKALALLADTDYSFLYTDIYESRADAYIALKKYDLAAADYEKAAIKSISPNDFFNKCADMYVAAGLPAKAIIYYLKVLGESPYDEKAQFGYGNALFQMKKYDLAAKCFSEMYGNVEAALMAGKSYYLQKNYSEANSSYQFVIDDYEYARDHPLENANIMNISAAKYSEACIGCGFALIGTKNFDGAKNYFSRAIKANPAVSEAYYGCGLAEFSDGNYSKALADLSAAIVRNPKNADAYFQRAETYAVMGMFVHATLNYKMAANIYKESHEDDKAQAALQKAAGCGSKPNLR